MNLQFHNKFFRLGLVAITMGALCSPSAMMANDKEDMTKEEEMRAICAPASCHDTSVTGLNAFGTVRALHGVLTNDIDPVKKIQSPITGQPVLVADDCGTTSFGGNAAVNPYKKLLVNEINPVRIDPRDACGSKLIADDKGVTCFSGNVGVMPRVHRKDVNGVLFVNEISPVKTKERKEHGEVVIDPCTQTPLLECFADNRCEATTMFNGNIQVKNKHMFGGIDPVSLFGFDAPTPILRLDFGPGLQPGAYVKFYFTGRDSGNSYDVFYLGEYYVNKASPIVIDENTYSVINGGVTPVEAFIFSVGDSVFISLSIDTTAIQYDGCLHYEIVSCEHLREVICSPEVPFIP